MDVSRLLFLDLECTGLDEHAFGAQILEVAALRVDAQFQEVGHYAAPCALADGVILEPGARAMHEKNGLLTVCSRTSSTVYQVETSLLSWIGRRYKLILAGASVHYDRRWIKAHMPRLFSRLHHQQLDVTSLLIARRCVEPNFSVPKSSEHRALSDIRDTLKLLTTLAHHV